MFRLHKILLQFLLPLVAVSAWSQKKDFHYRRPVNVPASADWYSLAVPPQVFLSANRDFSDFRIYELKGSDTVEVPYLVRVQEDEVLEEKADLDVFNESHKDKVLYVTFEVKKDQKINRLYLEFEEANFDGSVQLEGSNNQREWFSIGNPQRILSISRDNINFQATTLQFPQSSYRYLRVAISSDVALHLTGGSLQNREVKPGVHNTAGSSFKVSNDKSTKQTTILATLAHYQPVGSLTIDCESAADFYRPVVIEALRDSAKVPKGWTYYYDNLYSGYITSLDDRTFKFPYTLTSKLRVTIANGDNAPLTIKSISVTGPQVELVAKLNTGTTYLYYGSPTITNPDYELVHFTNKIPETLSTVTLGAEEVLIEAPATTSPLLQNKMWLWAIMGVIIAVLGYFTLKMMKAKS